MAEAFLQILLENLSFLIQEEIGLLLGVDKEMKKLSSTLTTIQTVLEDAEDKQLQDKAIRNWLQKLAGLSYEIEDILDECATEVAKMKYRNRKSSGCNVNRTVKKILYQHRIGKRMKEVAEKMDVVAAERAKFSLHEARVVLQSKVSVIRETGSMLNESHFIYEREEEKEKIVDILVNQVADRSELSVLPIIGLGGLGKTTFAQQVYNDERVNIHFPIKAWVCVSSTFDLKTLIKAMIESITKSGNASNLDCLDSLQQSLIKLLEKNRYLLVLDDVWNEDQEKWSMLKGLLARGSAGSSIIVTTRQKKVAAIMSTIPAHALKRLSKESCLLLFKERAFGQDEGEHTHLEAIGEQIVKKCAGVPLAAKTLGGLLRFERKPEDWLRVKESELWNLPQEETSIMPALRLSYNHLPFEYRQCFAYCAVFPKNSWIQKEELIFFWMSNGYISPQETLEVEDVGDKVFNELVLRSLVESVRSDLLGCILFQMHDLIHDLAQSIMDNKVPGPATELDNRQMLHRKICHVNLHKRFVAFPTSTPENMDLSSVLANFKCLRILDASSRGIKKVPSTIGNLKQVRYLNLSCTYIHTLPNALCSLWNLKILNLNYCTRLVCLPKRMRVLLNLRHLFLKGCTSLCQMPPKIGEMTSLKTLSQFIVGAERYNLLGELQFLNLGDSLDITDLDRVKTPLEAIKANLAQKNLLRKLRLFWNTKNSSKFGESMDEKVLEALEPHANVEELWISGFRGKNFPLWMRNSTMKNLVELRILECPNCSSLPQELGDLPCLETLALYDLALEYIIDNEVQEGVTSTKPKFLRLQQLSLYRIPFLQRLLKKETGVVAFPNLQDLNVHGCPLLSLSQLSSLMTFSCESIVHNSLHELDNLTSLNISFDENIIFVPKESLENLTCLESLELTNANEHSLPEEGLQGLKSLKELYIHDTERLTCLPQTWLSQLTTLEKLRLCNCSDLVEIPEEIKYLQNLTTLHLYRLPKMQCLPNALQYLQSLHDLSLYYICQLTSLPDNLPSLVYLQIECCQMLVSFPDGIKQWTKLESLSIMGCPEMERRYEKGKGEDWQLIAHIPRLHIGERDPLRSFSM